MDRRLLIRINKAIEGSRIFITIAEDAGLGRPEIKYPDQFENTYNNWKCGRIKAINANRRFGLKTIFLIAHPAT